jgi:serine/threonine protein kinase/tetratricopeptide (TPR) repeat protein
MLGSTISHYRITEKMGAGGMGVVYQAEDIRLNRAVALKFLPPAVEHDPQALSRFEREARTASSLNHPNICTVYDIGEEGGQHFIVMELLDGKSVAHINEEKPLNIDAVLELAIQIADALDAAHSKGIVHRDIKPDNIFVTVREQAKILDFGLAKLGGQRVGPGAASDTEITADNNLTQPGTIVGTVAYMSPEQVRGEELDQRSDLFSFGLVLYEMVTLRRAFTGDSVGMVYDAILNRAPVAPSAVRADLPRKLDEIIGKCLDKNRKFRYQSAADVRTDLQRLRRELATKETESWAVSAPQAHSNGRRRGLAIAAVVVTIAALAGLFYLMTRRRGGVESALGPIHSMAVLPLQNVSGDPNQDYFADGLTEELINSLAHIGSLRVTSRTSVMRFKGSTKTLPEIARALGVDAVLEGTVRREADRMFVTAQLVLGSTDQSVWAEKYDRDVRDVLTLQGDIARAIAVSVKSQVSPTEGTRLTSARPVNPESYEAYLRGRYFYNRRDAESLRKSLDFYKQAINVDPNYAQAYSGLADSYALIGYQNILAPRDSFPLAKDAVEKALTLDPNLAEPHASLGYIRMYYDWDFAGAEREFKKSIELNSNYVVAHWSYSILLSALLRPAEAEAEIKRAGQLDPLSIIVATDIGFELYYDRKYDQAIKQLQLAIEMNPKAPMPHFWLGRTYQALGRYEEALKAYEEGGPGIGDAPPTRAGVGHLYGVWGKREKALEVLAELDSKSKTSYVSPWTKAIIYAGLGDKEKVFEYLGQAYEERSDWLVWLKRDPRWDPFRDDPRFSELLHRVGLGT